MNWQIFTGLITAVASLGSLGSLAYLLKVRADNKKTLAEADKILEESKGIEFERLLSILAITSKELDKCIKQRNELESQKGAGD